MIILNEEYADSRGELEVFSVDQYTGELSDMKIICSLPGAYSLAYGYMLRPSITAYFWWMSD